MSANKSGMNANKISFLFFQFAFIYVMHKDVRMPRAQRPSWMAEGRTTQEQLSGSAGAAHLRTEFFKLQGSCKHG